MDNVIFAATVAVSLLVLSYYGTVPQDTVANPSQPGVSVITNQSPAGIEVIRIPLSPVAVDLEIIDGREFVLWSNGKITMRPLRSECPADLNGDGEVGAPDQLALLAAWGTKCP